MIDLDDPYALLFAAVDELTRAGLDHAVYGGLALAVYGEPRETKDADLAVANVSVDAVTSALAKILSTRDKDVEDARSVVQSVAEDLDLPLIEAEVALLATEIPTHDIRGRWQRVLADR